ncbi:hypothetical protein LCM20_11865 [Halobacillus litoralis]|uniref:hypothetical protein n=1 Tax=Halobacillus litoralis TaxID=45668 RepID=UPI001CD69081|nr:hypothetical protein [Halobacillus litoralis]MCA0971293.1 hypothetical protein [Halobacillus litoralis]
MKEQKFQQFLIESFRDGVCKRELRLSSKEAEWLRLYYPQASLVKTGTQQQKTWYEVRLNHGRKKTTP